MTDGLSLCYQAQAQKKLSHLQNAVEDLAKKAAEAKSAARAAIMKEETGQ